MLDLLRQSGVEVPAVFDELSDLTEYAVMTRYPGDYQKVTRKDYLRALRQAKKIFLWMEERFESDSIFR